MAQKAIRFEPGELVFAESHDPKFGFDEIIGIDVGSGQTITLEEIVLPVDVYLGATELVLDGVRYELIFGSVRVQFDKMNCDYVTGTRYGGRPRSIVATSTLETEIKTEIKEAGKVAAELALLTQDVGISGEIGKTDTRTHTQKESLVEMIPIVSIEGQDTLRIKMPEASKNGLSGTVISSVAADGSLTPFCRLTAKNLRKPVTGRIRVQARPTDMILKKLANLKNGKQTATIGDKGLRAGADALAQSQADADNQLRERVAAFALLEMPTPRDPREHVDLATKGFCFYPEFDNENDE